MPAPLSRAPRLLPALLATSALATTARAQTPPVPPWPVEVGTRPFAYVDADGEVDTADAGAFLVPEDRARPGGREIKLAYVRLRSRAARPGPPLVYLAGTGASAVDAARGQQLRLMEDLRVLGDVVLLEQRGTGLSEPGLGCEGRWDLPANRATDHPDTYAALGRQAARCAARLRARGIDPAAYTLAASADDVEALRRELGAARVNLFGFSTGSHLALEVARRHPASVGRLVLGGVEGPGQTYKLPAHHQAVLARLDSLVRADPRLSRHVPGLLELIDSVHARLRRSPVTVGIPLRTLLRYRERGFWGRRKIDALALLRPRYRVVLHEHDLRAMLALGMGRADFVREVPALYHAMARGDFQRAALLSLAVRKGQDVGSAVWYVMDCVDGVSPARADTIRRQAPATVVGTAASWPYPEVCAGWGPLPDAGEEGRAAVRSDVPALLAAGTLDGRTPPGQALEVLGGLPNGHLVVVENAAHSDNAVFLAPEVRAAVLRFLRGEAPGLDRLRLPPPEWAPPVPYAASLEDTLFAAGAARGGEAAVARYREIAAAHGDDYTYELTEAALNRAGYRLLRAGHVQAAVAVFRLNAELYPRSLNVHDSLGEGLLAAGDSAGASRSLRRAVSLGYNPHSFLLALRAEGRPPPQLGR